MQGYLPQAGWARQLAIGDNEGEVSGDQTLKDNKKFGFYSNHDGTPSFPRVKMNCVWSEDGDQMSVRVATVDTSFDAVLIIK